MGQCVADPADVVGVQELFHSGRTLAACYRALVDQVGEYSLAHVDERDVQPENERAMYDHLYFERKWQINRKIQMCYWNTPFPDIKTTRQSEPKHAV